MKIMNGLAVLAAVIVIGSTTMAQGGGGGFQGGPPQGGPPRGGQGGPGRMMMMDGPGGGSSLMLLQRQDVQEDLQLTAEQKAKLSDLQKKQRESMRGFRPDPDSDPEDMRAQMEKRRKEEDAKTNAILTTDQQKRIKEIAVQLQGNAAILNPDIQKELGITEDQKSAIEAALQSQRDQMEDLREQGRDGGPETMMASMKKVQESLNTELGKILTTEQAAKLKALGGKAFKRKDPPAGQFRGGGGPGGPGGGPGGGGGFGGPPPPIF